MTWTELVSTALDDNASPFERVEAAARLHNFARYLDDQIASGFDGLEVEPEDFSETAQP